MEASGTVRRRLHLTYLRHAPAMASPTHEIGPWADLAGVLETYSSRCVEGALTARDGTEYETVCDALTVFMLLQTHSQALANLVISGPGMFPSGWPIARTMLEVSCRTAWRMLPDDPFEGEARWICFMRREVERLQGEARWYAADRSSSMADGAWSRAEQMEKFLDAVGATLIDRGYPIPRKEPSLPRVLDDLGMKDQYFHYQVASERSHGTYVGLQAYTTNLGTDRKWGEFATMENWLFPLTMAMRSHFVLTEHYLRRTDADHTTFAPNDAIAEWDSALRRAVVQD